MMDSMGMRRAGLRKFGADAGTDRCLNYEDGERPVTPDKDRTYRRDTRPGARLRPMGPMRHDPVDHDRVFGEIDKRTKDTSDDVLRVTKKPLEAYMEERGEATYKRTIREPLGKGHTITVVPDHLRDHAFGNATNMGADGGAKVAMYPSVQADPKDEEVYRKSHGYGAVGERMYAKGSGDWAKTKVGADPDSFRFGKPASKGEINAVGEVMNPSLASNQPSRVVTKRTEDIKNFKHDVIGRSKYRGTAPAHKMPETFGRPPKKEDPYTAADCLVGDYTIEEQMPDADLGRSLREGFRNIARDPHHKYGKPSIRTHGANAEKVAEMKQTAYECFAPAAHEVRGVTDEDFLASRGATEIRDIFESIGQRFTDGEFTQLWARAAAVHDLNGDGIVSVEEFRRAVNELEDAREEGRWPDWWREE